MSDELIYTPGSDDRPLRSGRRSVRNFLLGYPEDVAETIAELYVRQFAEANLWSRPLTFHEIQRKFLLQPGEVMRVYKRYVSR